MRLSETYFFNRFDDYYAFMLLHFTQLGKPVRSCQCCGRFFVPKTKKITLGLIIALVLSLAVGLNSSAEELPETETAAGLSDLSTTDETEDTVGTVTETDADADVSCVENGVGVSQTDAEKLPSDDTETDLGGESIPNNEKNTEPGGNYEKNLFDEIYAAIELNADKFLSALAFVGTLIVGVTYKSGLLPLLRDALTKIKGAIDGVKADGEQTRAETDATLSYIGHSLDEIREELDGIKWQYESYDQLVKERNALRTVIEGQVNMLYAIFMTSALPQYQKDEIGDKISEMKEVLRSYDEIEEK